LPDVPGWLSASGVAKRWPMFAGQIRKANFLAFAGRTLEPF
jgi:hypothetical protein